MNGTVGSISNGATVTATVGTDGTVTGTSGQFVSGQMNQGFYASVSANNTAINVGDGSQYDYTNSSFTVSYWVKLPTGTTNPQWTMGKGNAYTGVGCLSATGKERGAGESRNGQQVIRYSLNYFYLMGITVC